VYWLTEQAGADGYLTSSLLAAEYCALTLIGGGAVSRSRILFLFQASRGCSAW